MNPGTARVRYDSGMKSATLSMRAAATRAGLTIRSLIAGCLLVLAHAAAAQPQPPLPTIELQAGIHLIRAEVASDNDTRMRGLMFRERLGPNQGMLFVFQVKAQQCFWMRNTLIPLTIAFIEDDGSVVNLADMKPRSEDSHCSGRPVRYALEMEQGWFAKRGLGAGARLSGPPGVFAERGRDGR